MHTLEITADNLIPTIEKAGIVVLDWWASWCGPCRTFGPIFEAAAAKHGDVVFGKVDTEAHPNLAAAFQIRAIPTVMAFRDGVLLFAQAGMLPENALEALVEKVRSLDMDEVRRALAEELAADEADASDESDDES